MAADFKITLLILLLTSSTAVLADIPATPKSADVAAQMKCKTPTRPFHMEADTFDYESYRPADLISFLKDTKFHDYVPEKMPEKWVKDGDIPELVNLLESKQESARLRSPYSSFLGSCRSTVGKEAARLISIFRGNKQTAMSDVFDINEIKQWYASSHNKN